MCCAQCTYSAEKAIIASGISEASYHRFGVTRANAYNVLDPVSTPAFNMSSSEMALPDLLRFCDSFELRQGLVTTREILDAYKEVSHSNVHISPYLQSTSGLIMLQAVPKSSCV